MKELIDSTISQVNKLIGSVNDENIKKELTNVKKNLLMIKENFIKIACRVNILEQEITLIKNYIGNVLKESIFPKENKAQIQLLISRLLSIWKVGEELTFEELTKLIGDSKLLSSIIDYLQNEGIIESKVKVSNSYVQITFRRIR